MSIGKRLIAERERLGMTQAEFYRAVGTSKSMQFYFETDHSKPGAEYLIAADGLGVDVLYVLTGRHGNPREPRAPNTARASKGSVAVAGVNNKVTVTTQPGRRKK